MHDLAVYLAVYHPYLRRAGCHTVEPCQHSVLYHIVWLTQLFFGVVQLYSGRNNNLRCAVRVQCVSGKTGKFPGYPQDRNNMLQHLTNTPPGEMFSTLCTLSNWLGTVYCTIWKWFGCYILFVVDTWLTSLRLV